MTAPATPPRFTMTPLTREQAEAINAAARRALETMRERITTNGAPADVLQSRGLLQSPPGRSAPKFRPGGITPPRVPHPRDTVRHRVRVKADRGAASITAPAGHLRNTRGEPHARVRVGRWQIILEQSLWAWTPRGYDWTPWRTERVLGYRDEWENALAVALSPAVQAEVGR